MDRRSSPARYVICVSLALAISPIAALADVSPVVDLPSLADKTKADLIQILGKPRYCMPSQPDSEETAARRHDARTPPGTPLFDQMCHFLFGWSTPLDCNPLSPCDPFSVWFYRGRIVAFQFLIGNARKRPREPAEALLQVGIHIEGRAPDRIIKNPIERPFTGALPSSRLTRFLPGQKHQDLLWSGVFDGKHWQELRVMQNSDRQCWMIIAIVADTFS